LLLAASGEILDHNAASEEQGLELQRALQASNPTGKNDGKEKTAEDQIAYPIKSLLRLLRLRERERER
jgi:hypothetical protein